MKLIISIIFAWMGIGMFAQTKTLYLIDKESNQAISFANLYYTGSKISFMSNDEGQVDLAILHNNEAIVFHHLSYEAVNLQLEDLTDTLYFAKKSYELPVFNFQNLSAQNLTEKAILAIPKNFILSEHYLKGKYLQVHKENGMFVRYIEAKIAMQNNGLHPNIAKIQEENFAILALRKSYNYEKNGEQHGDHLKDLMHENPIQYLEQHYLNINNLDLYIWTFLENIGDAYQIHFQSKQALGNKSYQGKILIKMDDLAIVSISIQSYPNINQQKNITSSWKFINGWYEANFAKNEKGYYLLNCAQWYHHQIIKPNQDWHPVIEEKFEWETEEIHKERIDETYSQFSSLYSLSLPYNEEIWKNYPIDSTIRKDLESKHSLEYQFRQP